MPNNFLGPGARLIAIESRREVLARQSRNHKGLVSAYRRIGVSVCRRKHNNSPLSNLQNSPHENLRKRTTSSLIVVHAFSRTAPVKRKFCCAEQLGLRQGFVSHLATNMLALVGR